MEGLSTCSTSFTVVLRKRFDSRRGPISSGDRPVYGRATPTTGMPILGKMSVGVRMAASGPKIRIIRAMTMKV